MAVGREVGFLSGWRRRRRPARFAILGAVVLTFVLVSTIAVALFFPRPALGAQTSLTVLTGSVLVKDPAGGDFLAAQNGQLVAPGTTVKTGDDGNAVLTFFDGSTVTVEPGTEFTVKQFTVTSSGDLIAEMEQISGRTWHVVTHILTPSSKYNVKTPSATASVRGTAFHLGVTPTTTNVGTKEGVVATTAGGATVDVTPDKQVDVNLGNTPPTPVDLPPPPATVKITLDATQNAAVINSNGLSVGCRTAFRSATSQDRKSPWRTASLSWRFRRSFRDD
jgi:hypothetical protein